MSEPTKDLIKFLKPFPKDVQENTLWLRDFVWKLYPDCNELIYDNYNALVIGFGPTDKAGDAFVSLAVYSNILQGKGSLYRSLRVTDMNEFPKPAIKKLLKQAYVNSIARLKDKQSLKGKIIVKSISEKKRRPGN